MLSKTVTYTDYAGIERKEIFRFNLTEAEITELQMSEYGGLSTILQRIIDSKDSKEIYKMFKKIVLLAYGVMSDDGRRFIKTDQVKEEFSQTEAFSIICMELLTDSKSASDFINGIVPSKYANALKNNPLLANESSVS